MTVLDLATPTGGNAAVSSSSSPVSSGAPLSPASPPPQSPPVAAPHARALERQNLERRTRKERIKEPRGDRRRDQRQADESRRNIPPTSVASSSPSQTVRFAESIATSFEFDDYFLRMTGHLPTATDGRGGRRLRDLVGARLAASLSYKAELERRHAGHIRTSAARFEAHDLAADIFHGRVHTVVPNMYATLKGAKTLAPPEHEDVSRSASRADLSSVSVLSELGFEDALSPSQSRLELAIETRSEVSLDLSHSHSRRAHAAAHRRSVSPGSVGSHARDKLRAASRASREAVARHHAAVEAEAARDSRIDDWLSHERWVSDSHSPANMSASLLDRSVYDPERDEATSEARARHYGRRNVGVGDGDRPHFRLHPSAYTADPDDPEVRATLGEDHARVHPPLFRLWRKELEHSRAFERSR